MNKRDFGSFHSSNVQELLSLPEEEYVPPKYPFDLSKFPERFAFGEYARKEYFLLEDSCVFLNHGAFGAVLKPALDVCQKWQRYSEREPLRFYDRELLPFLADVTRRLSKFIKCDPTDLVLTTNVTTAINAVIRSLSFHPGDVILCFNITYGAVKKLIKQISLETGAVVKELEITFPVGGKEQVTNSDCDVLEGKIYVIKEQQVISLLEEGLKEDNVKLAVVDHIPSNAPIILPVQHLAKLCHSRGVPVLIDGAHALGSLPLDMNLIDADFYVSNAHKWFCSPKGAAFMYVRKSFHDMVRPLVISHGFGSGFNSEFIWTGLHDYSPMLTLTTLVEFWNQIGVDKIMSHNRELAKSAGLLLMQTWKTEPLAPSEMFGSMILVKLPKEINGNNKSTYADGEQIQNQLYHEYNIEVPIKCISGILCVRISAHIYNTLDQYQILADAILDISKSRKQ